MLIPFPAHRARFQWAHELPAWQRTPRDPGGSSIKGKRRTGCGRFACVGFYITTQLSLT